MTHIDPQDFAKLMQITGGQPPTFDQFLQVFYPFHDEPDQTARSDYEDILELYNTITDNNRLLDTIYRIAHYVWKTTSNDDTEDRMYQIMLLIKCKKALQEVKP